MKRRRNYTKVDAEKFLTSSVSAAVEPKVSSSRNSTSSKLPISSRPFVIAFARRIRKIIPLTCRSSRRHRTSVTFYAHRITPLQRDFFRVAWNVDRLLFRLEEIREFLTCDKPNVFLITETFLGPTVCSTGTIDLVTIPGRGTAIAVNTCIDHHRVVLPPRQNIEPTAVELSRILGGVFLVSAYKPRALDTFIGAHRMAILADDLNCKHPEWGSRLIKMCIRDSSM